MRQCEPFGQLSERHESEPKQSPGDDEYVVPKSPKVHHKRPCSVGFTPAFADYGVRRDPLEQRLCTCEYIPLITLDIDLYETDRPRFVTF